MVKLILTAFKLVALRTSRDILVSDVLVSRNDNHNAYWLRFGTGAADTTT